jgi:hypothetical protein
MVTVPKVSASLHGSQTVVSNLYNLLCTALVALQLRPCSLPGPQLSAVPRLWREDTYYPAVRSGRTGCRQFSGKGQNTF